MKNGKISRLNPSDPHALEDYERAFYEAFTRVPSNRLVRQLWLWDDERRRLKTRIAYEHQTIWVSRHASGELQIAIAVNDDPVRAQSAAYGFSIPCEAGIFEVLTLFASGPLSYGDIRSFWQDFLAKMRDAGLARGYATSAAPLLPLYKRAGWEIAEKTEIAGEIRYFLTLHLDCGRALELLRGHDAECEDKDRFVSALVSGGDPRLDLDPVTGCNIYGCCPTPDPMEMSFGATTASTISTTAFMTARDSFGRLAPQSEGASSARLRAETQAISREIAELAGLPGARTLLAASGTDAIMLATIMIAERDPSPLTTIIVGIEESGSGVGNAVIGCHFQPRTPNGGVVTPGTPLAPGRDLARIDLPLRDCAGAPLDFAEIDAAVSAAARREISAGRRVVVHRLDSSKTGLTAPSLACLSALEAEHGDRFCVLVDACQLRASTASLTVYHRRGYPVLVTGSKLIAGPAFSGAVILPAGFERPAPILPGYDHVEAPALGVLLRWQAALSEWRGFGAIPEERKVTVARIFAQIAGRAISARMNLRAVVGAPHDRAAEGGWDAHPTIFTFLVTQANGQALGMEELRRLYFLLLERRETTPAMRIGQPVKLGNGGVAALRISLDARRMRALAQSEKVVVETARDLDRLFDRLESLIDASSPSD